MVSVAFVCLGNICRSPMAEAVFAHEVKKAGLESQISVDSFGTSAFHIGDSPDRRSAATCKKHGVPVKHKAQQIFPNHFQKFDYILAMDENNLHNLQRLAPRNNQARLSLFGKYRTDPQFEEIVDDPYYGGDQGFEYNFQQITDFSQGLLKEIKSDLL